MDEPENGIILLINGLKDFNLLDEYLIMGMIWLQILSTVVWNNWFTCQERTQMEDNG
jgi:hypothetical protein